MRSFGTVVTISFSVVYTIRTNKEDIKGSRIHGNRTPNANYYRMGYNGFVAGVNGGVFAWADAVILVAGMSGSHVLNSGMAFQDER